MTDKPTPTDAELKAMWQLHAADIGGLFYYARAVLAKWGQPVQAREDSVLYDPKAVLDVFHSARAGSEKPVGYLRGILAVIAHWESRPEPHRWMVPAPAWAEEPFCWHWENTFNGGMGAVKKNPETLGINMSHPDYKWTALYTAPQPVAREPLTDEQMAKLYRQSAMRDRIIVRGDWEQGVRDAEAAHGIKGGQHGTNT